jgi:di/tricarboxylate transporter
LALGPALFTVVLLLPKPTDLTPQAQHLVVLIVLTAAWWSIEAVPFAATSLVLLVLPAVMGLMKPEAAAAPYADPNVFLPVLAATAKAPDIHPYLLMLSATLVASCGFMLPVATPPNAVAFASGYVTAPQMVRAGFVVDVLGALLVTLAVYTLGRLVFGLWYPSHGLAPVFRHCATAYAMTCGIGPRIGRP